jgi:hypothetical protein
MGRTADEHGFSVADSVTARVVFGRSEIPINVNKFSNFLILRGFLDAFSLNYHFVSMV